MTEYLMEANGVLGDEHSFVRLVDTMPMARFCDYVPDDWYDEHDENDTYCHRAGVFAYTTAGSGFCGFFCEEHLSEKAPKPGEEASYTRGLTEHVTAPGDQRIADAARVSIAGEGVRPTSDDRKLIRFLVKNKHTTPIEQVRFTFHVRLPIFVARQWIRHRTGCLPGDAVISFQRPDNGGHHPKTMAEVARSFDDPAQRVRLCGMQLRCTDKRGGVQTTHIKKVWSTGMQPVYVVHLASGRTLRATLSHQVPVADPAHDSAEWMTLEELKRRVEAPGWCRPLSLYAVETVYPRDEEKDATDAWKAVLFEEEGPADETWRAIPKWEGRYEVSSYGRVRGLLNTRGRPFDEPRVKRQTDRNGYRVVSLSCGGVSRAHLVHQLVVTAFLGPRPDGLEVRHLDGSRWDNRVSNLAYGTSAENSMDMILHGRQGRLEAMKDKVLSIEYDGEEATWDMEVEGPHHNFVADGIVVHNSFNEESARYGQLAADFYVPTLERLMAGGQAKKNKQGSGASLDEETARRAMTTILNASQMAYSDYEKMLGAGLARELARMVLPVNIYTQWFWTTDLHNLMHFLRLRVHKHAQWETSRYAHVIVPMAEAIAPYAMEAFLETVEGST